MPGPSTTEVDRPVCDFCTVGAPSWVYPCDVYTLFVDLGGGSSVEYTSVSDWLACVACGDLVEADSWEALARRSADMFSFGAASALPVEVLEQHAARMQAGFRDHRRGQARKGWG